MAPPATAATVTAKANLTTAEAPVKKPAMPPPVAAIVDADAAAAPPAATELAADWAALTAII